VPKYTRSRLKGQLVLVGYAACRFIRQKQRSLCCYVSFMDYVRVFSVKYVVWQEWWGFMYSIVIVTLSNTLSCQGSCTVSESEHGPVYYH